MLNRDKLKSKGKGQSYVSSKILTSMMQDDGPFGKNRTAPLQFE